MSEDFTDFQLAMIDAYMRSYKMSREVAEHAVREYLKNYERENDDN